MTIDEWARREAEEHIEGIEEIVRGEWDETENLELKRDLFADGIVYALNALLSDDAVEAAADQMWRNGGVVSGAELRLAVQAAIDAVTKGDTE